MIPSPLQAFFASCAWGFKDSFFWLLQWDLAHAQTAPAHADYQRATYDPIHFKPAIDKATNAQCLACHAEVLEPSVRNESIAGVKASQAKAWYQQVSTYQGEQDTFHRRHMSTAYAKQVMNLQCTTCHQGNDPRDEAAGTSASNQNHTLTLRKMASAEKTCLMCHGTLNYENMGLPGPWPQVKDHVSKQLPAVPRSDPHQSTQRQLPQRGRNRKSRKQECRRLLWLPRRTSLVPHLVPVCTEQVGRHGD
jgi:hypothetical protein